MSDAEGARNEFLAAGFRHYTHARSVVQAFEGALLGRFELTLKAHSWRSFARVSNPSATNKPGHMAMTAPGTLRGGAGSADPSLGVWWAAPTDLGPPVLYAEVLNPSNERFAIWDNCAHDRVQCVPHNGRSLLYLHPPKDMKCLERDLQLLVEQLDLAIERTLDISSGSEA